MLGPRDPGVNIPAMNLKLPSDSEAARRVDVARRNIPKCPKSQVQSRPNISSTGARQSSSRLFEEQAPISRDTRNQLYLEKFTRTRDSYGVVGACGVMRARRRFL